MTDDETALKILDTGKVTTALFCCLEDDCEHCPYSREACDKKDLLRGLLEMLKLYQNAV